MRLLANENFPLTSVKILEKAGYDIIYAGLDFKGILDIEVIDIAIKDERTIITFDRDYGELIFKKGYRPKSGVIFLRWDNFQPDEPGKYLVELFETKEITYDSRLTVITEKNIRQRRYPFSH
jgi:predicted nuclease of predicted toxin-antitoxin system